MADRFPHLSAQNHPVFKQDQGEGRCFPISSKVFLYTPSHRVTPVVEHWLERERAQWIHHEESILEKRTDPSHERTFENKNVEKIQLVT